MLPSGDLLNFSLKVTIIALTTFGKQFALGLDCKGMFLSATEYQSDAVRLRHGFLPSVHAFSDSHVYLAEREHVLILSNLHIEVWMK